MFTVTYGAETRGLEKKEIHNLDVMEMKCLQGMCVVIKLYGVRLEEVRRRIGVRNKMSDRVDQKFWRC